MESNKGFFSWLIWAYFWMMILTAKAGVTMTTALLSLAMEMPIPTDLAMTGEVITTPFRSIQQTREFQPDVCVFVIFHKFSRCRNKAFFAFPFFLGFQYHGIPLKSFPCLEGLIERKGPGSWWHQGQQRLPFGWRFLQHRATHTTNFPKIG